MGARSRLIKMRLAEIEMAKAHINDLNDVLPSLSGQFRSDADGMIAEYARKIELAEAHIQQMEARDDQD